MSQIFHVDNCAVCGSRLTGRWERLTPGLVRTLLDMWKAVVEIDQNNVHLQKHLRLSKNAYANFFKLRYFGLVAKSSTRGYWLITRRGGKFIHGRETVNARLLIFRNHIKDRSAERVGILDVLELETPYWPSREDYFAEPAVNIEMHQAGLFA